MDERLFAQLAHDLPAGPCVLASVVATRGATPRKTGSRMLISRTGTRFSVGGGAAEARVVQAARELLDAGAHHRQVDIDLGGGPGAAGICGGHMRIALRCWQGAADGARARAIADQLAAGHKVELGQADLADPAITTALPNPRLLIVGAGHCAAALCELAQYLDLDLWVQDSRAEYLEAAQFASVNRIVGASSELARAFGSERTLLVVLLNREFAQDVAALKVISAHSCRYIGMMGSQRRIAQVRKALGPQVEAAMPLTAPVGIEIGAHTPHEIAVSILAQLIQTINAPG